MGDFTGVSARSVFSVATGRVRTSWKSGASISLRKMAVQGHVEGGLKTVGPAAIR